MGHSRNEHRMRKMLLMEKVPATTSSSCEDSATSSSEGIVEAVEAPESTTFMASAATRFAFEAAHSLCNSAMDCRLNGCKPFRVPPVTSKFNALKVEWRNCVAARSLLLAPLLRNRATTSLACFVSNSRLSETLLALVVSAEPTNAPAVRVAGFASCAFLSSSLSRAQAFVCFDDVFGAKAPGGPAGVGLSSCSLLVLAAVESTSTDCCICCCDCCAFNADGIIIIGCIIICPF